MLRNVFGKNIFERRRSIIWWCLGIGLLIIIICLTYPAIRDNDEMAKLLEGYPKEMLAAFGISDVADMTTPAGYLNAELFGLMLPLILMIFSIGAGTRAIAGEEEARTIDLLLSHPVRRSQVVVQSFAALVVLLLLLALVMLVALVAGSALVAMEIGLDRLVAAAIASGLLALFFGTLALTIGAATGKRGLSMAVTATVAVITYFLNSFSSSLDWLKPLRPISPFYYATNSEPLKNGLNLLHVGTLVAITAVLVAIAVALFERRDVAV